jgi:hypothetical protein
VPDDRVLHARRGKLALLLFAWSAASGVGGVLRAPSGAGWFLIVTGAPVAALGVALLGSHGMPVVSTVEA